MGIRRVIVVALLVAPLLIASDLDASTRAASVPSSASDHVQSEVGVPATVRRYAPVFFFHHDEEHWPMSAKDFIDNSTLKFRYKGVCSDDVVAEDPKPGRLGGLAPMGPYKAQPRKNVFCELKGKAVFSDQLTLPGLDHPDRPNRLPEKNGFVLDLDNDMRAGTDPATGGTVYYDYIPGEYVGYWLLYGFSDGHGPGPADHEADWEHVTVRLFVDANGVEQADAIAYFYHGHECVFDFKGGVRGGDCTDITDMPLLARTFLGSGHPKVFVADGSHASYWFRHCPQFLDNCSPTGLRWKSWLDADLLNLRTTKWYSFGGKWGKSRLGHRIQGPSPWRSSEPSDWFDEVNLDR